MLSFINRDTVGGDSSIKLSEIEKLIQEALVEVDFGEDEVEIRFADSNLLSYAIRYFNHLTYQQKYVTQIARETEIYVFGVDGNKCRYTFLNSIPSGE